MTQQTHLDDQELLHLAIEATAKERHADAMEYLKRATQSRSNPHAHFLLAAEYAQLGLNDRAVAEFRAALEIEPALHAARFQLGLLFIVNGRIQEALDTWQPLESTSAAEPYATFARGLARIAREDFAGAIEDLKRGIEINRVNPALNTDMNGVLERTKAQLDGGRSGPPDAPPAPQGGHIFLSAYTGKPS